MRAGDRSIRSRRAASAVALICILALPRASEAQNARSAPRPRAVAISFKLDPRLTRSLFMGERWVSPATYTSSSVEHGKVIAVEARSHLVDTTGMASRVRAHWAPADPGMMTVTHSGGNEVQLAVHRAGETLVTVTYGQLSSTFVVKTVRHGADLWRVDISPVQAAGARLTRASRAAVER